MKEAVYTDLKQVEELKAVAVYAKEKAQIIYNELIKTGVEFSLSEVFDIWQRRANAEFIKNKVIDKKLESEQLVIAGLKLSRSKFYDMIEIENMDSILSTYEGVYSDYQGHTVGRVSQLIELKSGVLSLKPDYEDTIFDMCTLFATSVEAQQKAQKIIAMAEHLNGLNDVFHSSWREKVEIRGLEIVNEMYVPDMREIGHIINP